jgi:hypothetical protein
MHFDLHVPCGNCPFLRNGGIRLKPARVKQICLDILSDQGKTFACHKTTVERNGELAEAMSSRHCAGALIFSEKNGNCTQMMRIAERLGMYDSKKLMANQEVVDQVFDSEKEMMEANRPLSAQKPG